MRSNITLATTRRCEARPHSLGVIQGGRTVSPYHAIRRELAVVSGCEDDRQSPSDVSSRLLERTEELDRLAAAITAHGRVLIVEGAAGMGKSALLAAAEQFGIEAGARVLTARGGFLERDLGHGIARQLFERPVHACGRVERSRWLSGAARLAEPVLSFERPDATGATEDPVFAAQHGLYWLVSNIASEQPLVLVVDDLHWADRASVRWLVYLARRLDGLPIVVIGGWRPGERGAPTDLLDGLGAERMALRPLSVSAAATLIGRELGHDCEASMALACHLGTGGNPLLLSQLAQALDACELPFEADRITEVGARAVGPHVRARLAAMSESVTEVASAAAVLDGEFAPRQLAAMTGLTLQQVREACDGLVAACLLTGSDPFVFVHPLVRSAIYDALSPAGRRAAHRIAADVLDAEGLVDRAAVHLVAAERTGDGAIVVRLMAAAERAIRRGAIDEPVALLRRALEEPPPAAARYGVLMALARAEWQAEDEAAVTHAQAAIALADSPEEHEGAALWLARVLSPAGSPDQALDVLGQAAEQLRAVAPERALGLDVERLSWSLMLARPPRGIRQAAAELRPRVAPDSRSARILDGTVACVGATTGAIPAADAAELALGALADPRMLKDLAMTAAYHFPLSALGDCERLDEYTDWVRYRREIAARAGSRIDFRVLGVHSARIAWLRGDLAVAVQETRDALVEASERGYTFWVPFAASSLVAALVEQGDLDQAERVLSRYDLADGITFVWWMLVPGRVSLALARGDVDRARAQLSALPSERAALTLQLAPCEVAVALASGATLQAQDRAHAMVMAAERFGAPAALGIAKRLLGLARGGEEGLVLLQSAIESLERSPRRLELARTLVDYGASLRRQAQRAAAREPLRRGLDLAQRCGAAPLVKAAADELRATGARPRRHLLTGRDSLTPSELRVAELVAQGRSNPDVAQALFVTRATVETHLHAVFRKLNVTRREQLGTALTATPADERQPASRAV